jgi:hypothetical protein
LWYFSSAEKLVKVFAESCGFPFCVTSLDTEYLICFDDNDCLLTTGKAVSWLEQLK